MLGGDFESMLQIFRWQLSSMFHTHSVFLWFPFRVAMLTRGGGIVALQGSYPG